MVLTGSRKNSARRRFSTKAKPVSEKAPIYFQMGADFVRGGAGLKLLNYDTVQKDHKGICASPPWPTGQRTANDGPWRFPVFVEAPRFLIDRKLGRPPKDIEGVDGFWFVSSEMKAVLEATDPAGCEFRPCETVLASGDRGPERWLCTITRTFFDAVDFDATEALLVGKYPNGVSSYTPTPRTKLRFRQDIVKGAHLFHVVEISSRTVYCDQIMKDACKTAGLKGIRFAETAPR